MTKEDLTKDIKVLNNTKKLTGNIGLYRRLSSIKAFLTKYKKYPGISKILDEIADVDLLNGKGLEKVSKFDEYQETAIKNVSIILDFEESKKTLKACKNSAKKYAEETPESAMTNTGVYKNFKQEKRKFQNLLTQCKKLQQKLDNNEISMERFVAEVSDIKKGILGTLRGLKAYGLFEKKDKEIKEEIFNY